MEDTMHKPIVPIPVVRKNNPSVKIVIGENH